MSLRVNDRPARRNGVLLIGDGHDSYLVAPRGDRHRINATARAIWELCDGSTQIDEMADAICQVFPIEREMAVADVSLALETFGRLELLETDPGERGDR
jgi:hypothetical protein